MSKFGKLVATLFDKQQTTAVSNVVKPFTDAELLAALNKEYATWSLVLPSYFEAELSDKDKRKLGNKLNESNSTIDLKQLEDINFAEISKNPVTGEPRDVRVVAAIIVMEILSNKMLAICADNEVSFPDDGLDGVVNKVEVKINQTVTGGIRSEKMFFNDDHLGKLYKKKTTSDIRRGSFFDPRNLTKKVAGAMGIETEDTKVDKLCREFISKSGWQIVKKEKVLDREMVDIGGGNGNIPRAYIDEFIRHHLVLKRVNNLDDMDRISTDFNKVLFGDAGKKGFLAQVNESKKVLSKSEVSDLMKACVQVISIGAPSTYAAGKEEVQRANVAAKAESKFNRKSSSDGGDEPDSPHNGPLSQSQKDALDREFMATKALAKNTQGGSQRLDTKNGIPSMPAIIPAAKLNNKPPPLPPAVLARKKAAEEEAKRVAAEEAKNAGGKPKPPPPPPRNAPSVPPSVPPPVPPRRPKGPGDNSI